MTVDQVIISLIFTGLFIFLIWGKIRYDIVAFTFLIIAVISGQININDAFKGFSHPATILVALVLLVSAGMVNSGVIYLITNSAFRAVRSTTKHVLVISSLGAFLSSFINNIAALALLMPIDLQVAKKANRTARSTLMPLSFATILGGMVTLVGTPPNIIISSIRQQSVGEPFNFFDFTPVGLIVCLSGLFFITSIGWKLIGSNIKSEIGRKNRLDSRHYFTELIVPENSKYLGAPTSKLENEIMELGGELIKIHGNSKKISIGEKITILTTTDTLDEIRITLDLRIEESQKISNLDNSREMDLFEVVVDDSSRLLNKTAESVGLFWRQQTTLIGISRQGNALRKEVKRTKLRVGDILLLLAPKSSHDEISNWLGALTLENRDLNFTKRGQAWLSLSAFVVLIFLSSIQIISLTLGLSVLVCTYIFLNILPVSQLYENIAWPIIILLGSLIPLGYALEETGLTQLLATFLIHLSANLPLWVLLSIVMLITMTLSDILNNTATTIVVAPIGLSLAQQLSVNPDPFLMGIAVSASCAFLTPIGHKNNTLIMGPGGYNFFDYWRIGLPLQVLIILVSIPSILIFWSF